VHACAQGCCDAAVTVAVSSVIVELLTVIKLKGNHSFSLKIILTKTVLMTLFCESFNASTPYIIT